ncbi:hypothetical protein Hanom_Chr16g01501291 [Helianthus anomalus]
MVNTRPKNKKTLKTQASIEDFDHQSTQSGALIGSSHLHLIVYDYNRLRHNVYEMLSDHSGWFVKYRVDLGGLLHALPELAYWCQNRFNFSDVIRGEKEEDTFLLLRIPGKMILPPSHFRCHGSHIHTI